MSKLILFLLLSSSHAMAVNRPYNDIIKSFVKNKCTQSKENIYLTKDERKIIENHSGTKIYGGLALRYITTCPSQNKAYHYVDSHIVRTLNETVVMTIKENQLESFIVSSFNEPPEYKAPLKWYNQFKGSKGNEILKAREQIDALSGATLTVNASISAVNKTLALHRFLNQK